MVKRVVIGTALPVEHQAICSHLSNLSESTHEHGTVYTLGTFHGKSDWNACVVETGCGNSNAAQELERAASFFNPLVVLFVGVAGGIKDVSLGDVVAATKVYDYHSGKDEAVFRTRPTIGETTYRMEQRARAVAKKDAWRTRIRDATLPTSPKAIVAPIAAGAMVVASNKSKVFQLLRKNYSDAVAVEMEGYGFLRAARALSSVDSLVIRGISDLIEGKAEADAAGSQVVAADHASAFAFEILDQFQLRATTSFSAVNLEDITYATAPEFVRSLYSKYHADVVEQRLKAILTAEQDPTNCAVWCFGLRYGEVASAISMLEQITGDPGQHEVVRSEAEKSLAFLRRGT